MKKIFIAIALLATLPVLAKYKVKHKSFEPVIVHDVHAIAGHYVGIEGEFEIDLRVAGNTVTGTLVRDGVEQPLRDIVIDGADFRSNLVQGTFVDRNYNGDHAFGFLATWPRIDHDGNSFDRLFCRRR